jgi:SRSO17 transposase
LLASEPETAPSANGALTIDDTGDRKKGNATDHVSRQYLGSVGRIDNGIVAVTTLWADEQHYYPLHVTRYTPAARLANGKQDEAFHTKPQIALALIDRAQATGIRFQAIVADRFYMLSMRLRSHVLFAVLRRPDLCRRSPSEAVADWAA